MLRPNETLLVVVDLQERLLAAMPEADRERVVRNATRLVTGVSMLDVPVLYTEQYPRGLGPTVGEVATALRNANAAKVEKVEFDACRNADFGALLERHRDRRSIVLAGVEAHVCVHQTARSLVGAGHVVHVVADAACSRDPRNARIAEGLWAAAGALVSCTETVLFDLVGVGSGETFKAISRLVR